jgi:ribosomal protein L40E
MVQFEKEIQKQTELLAVCEMCASNVPDAKSCYVDHSRLTFLCIQCFADIPSEAETERMVAKLIAYQKLWAEKKAGYVKFITVAKEVNLSENTPETLCLDALSIADVQGN